MRPQFSSRLATIITMIGVSVGLGNVWRFPYMMGSYGGSAFLFVYLIFTLFFAVPAVMVEWGLGRSTRQGPVGAFTQLWGKKAGYVIGLMLLFTVLVAESYYLYVIANISYATGFIALRGFDPGEIENFKLNLNNSSLQYLICLALLVASALVLQRGLKHGIVSLSKVFVPFFVLVMLVLIAFALQMEHAGTYLLVFLQPDFGQLKPVHIFAALGQAFFSLGLGGTFLLVFGSYLRADENLLNTSITMALGDIAAALLAGLFIVPTILALGLNMAEGPGLLFHTLPELFQRLPFGRLVGGMFLLALFMVTFISSLAALEVLVAGIGELFGGRWSRKRLINGISILVAIIVLPIALKPSIIGSLDLIFGSGMQVLGSLLALLAFTWGQSKLAATRAIFGPQSRGWHSLFYYWVKWCVPATLMLVLGAYIISSL